MLKEPFGREGKEERASDKWGAENSERAGREGDRTAVKGTERGGGGRKQENGDPKTGTGEGSRGGGGGAGREGSKGGGGRAAPPGALETGPPVLWESCLSPVGALPSRRGQILHKH